MSFRHRIAVLLLVVFAVATVASANHAWGTYHWARKSNPFTLKVHDNVTSNWEPYLAEAQTDWNKSSILDLNVLWNSPLSSAKRCTSATGVIEVCNASYGQNGWLGIAGISLSGGHIVKGYTKLNDTYFSMARYNTPAFRRMVTCQEIGHDFGLAHQDEGFSNYNLGSCMDYTNAPQGGTYNGFNYGPNNEHPNQHDFDQIAAIYNHVDSTTTIASFDEGMSVAMSSRLLPITIESDFDEDGNEPWHWGTPVGFDGEGRANRFYQELGNGTARVTHVTWADDSVRGNPHDRHEH